MGRALFQHLLRYGLVVAVAVLVVVYVLGRFGAHLLLRLTDDLGGYPYILTGARCLVSLAQSIVGSPWFLCTILVSTSLLVGAALDWGARYLDGRREKTKRKLGLDLEHLGREMQNLHRVRNKRVDRVPWPDSIREVVPNVRSTLLSIEKEGFPAPTFDQVMIEKNIPKTLEYFSMIGRLIAEGHYRTAKAEAKERKAAF